MLNGKSFWEQSPGYIAGIIIWVGAIAGMLSIIVLKAFQIAILLSDISGDNSPVYGLVLGIISLIGAGMCVLFERKNPE